MKAEYFMNITCRGLTVHMLRGAPKTCFGKQMIPAELKDMLRDREVEIVNDKPYRISVCRNCIWRKRLYEEAERYAADSATKG